MQNGLDVKVINWFTWLLGEDKENIIKNAAEAQIFMHRKKKKKVFQAVLKLDRLSFGKPDLHEIKKRSCIQCTKWKWFCYHKIQIGTSSLHFTFTSTTTASLSPFSAITTRAGHS